MCFRHGNTYFLFVLKNSSSRLNLQNERFDIRNVVKKAEEITHFIAQLKSSRDVSKFKIIFIIVALLFVFEKKQNRNRKALKNHFFFIKIIK